MARRRDDPDDTTGGFAVDVAGGEDQNALAALDRAAGGRAGHGQIADQHILRRRRVAAGEDKDGAAFDPAELGIGQGIAAAGQPVANQRLGGVG